MYFRTPEPIDARGVDWWRDNPVEDGQMWTINLPHPVPVSLTLRAAPTSTRQTAALGWMQVAGVAVGIQADHELANYTRDYGQAFHVRDVEAWWKLPVIEDDGQDIPRYLERCTEAKQHGGFITWNPDDLPAILRNLPEWAENTRHTFEAVRRMVVAADAATQPHGEPGHLTEAHQVIYVATLYAVAWEYGIGNAREYAAQLLSTSERTISRRVRQAVEQGLLVQDNRGRYVPPHAQQEGTDSE